jgi:hypothetical protein
MTFTRRRVSPKVALDEIAASDAAPVLGREPQVHGERREVVGDARDRRGAPGLTLRRGDRSNSGNTGRVLADVETRTEPDLKHLAVEAGGDACPQAGELAGVPRTRRGVQESLRNIFSTTSRG